MTIGERIYFQYGGFTMTSNPTVLRLAGTVLVLGSLALPASQLAAAQDQAQQQQSAQGASTKLSEQDREFLMKAAQGGMMEVEAAKLAQQRAADPDVKNFAQTLLKDHQAASEKLERIAKEKGITLPRALDDKHRKQLEELSKVKAEDFDRLFMSVWA
jgi:putative membrane protein